MNNYNPEDLLTRLAWSAEVLNDFYVTADTAGEFSLAHELCLFGDPVSNNITLLELTNMAYAHEQQCEQAKLLHEIERPVRGQP